MALNDTVRLTKQSGCWLSFTSSLLLFAAAQGRIFSFHLCLWKTVELHALLVPFFFFVFISYIKYIFTPNTMQRQEALNQEEEEEEEEEEDKFTLNAPI